jgi:AcrR family transcriptional regulator
MAVAARRERERIARREAILDAAQELVAMQGYHGMRMDSVAEAAELSKGTLYLYFENKDALCAAVATTTSPKRTLTTFGSRWSG